MVALRTERVQQGNRKSYSCKKIWSYLRIGFEFNVCRMTRKILIIRIDFYFDWQGTKGLTCTIRSRASR